MNEQNMLKIIKSLSITGRHFPCHQLGIVVIMVSCKIRTRTYVRKYQTLCTDEIEKENPLGLDT